MLIEIYVCVSLHSQAMSVSIFNRLNFFEFELTSPILLRCSSMFDL